MYNLPLPGDSGAPLYLKSKVEEDGSIEGQTLIGFNPGREGSSRKEKSNIQWWLRVKIFTCTSKGAWRSQRPLGRLTAGLQLKKIN